MNNKSHKDKIKEDASLARKRRHLTVPASPFNSVKLDLAIIIFMAFIVLLIVSGVVEDAVMQILYLAAFGIVSMLWLIFRTRKITRALKAGGQEQNHHET